MEEVSRIKIEVVYALPNQQVAVRLDVPEGTTVAEAVMLSQLLEKFPDIKLDGQNKLGIFGRLTKPDTALRQGDRVEIYRPLLADPKEVRKRRAAEGKKMKKGAGEVET